MEGLMKIQVNYLVYDGVTKVHEGEMVVGAFSLAGAKNAVNEAVKQIFCYRVKDFGYVMNSCFELEA